VGGCLARQRGAGGEAEGKRRRSCLGRVQAWGGLLVQSDQCVAGAELAAELLLSWLPCCACSCLSCPLPSLPGPLCIHSLPCPTARTCALQSYIDQTSTLGGWSSNCVQVRGRRRWCQGSWAMPLLVCFKVLCVEPKPKACR